MKCKSEGSRFDHCRYSDAAYGKGTGEVTIAVGLIARPNILNTEMVDLGSATEIRRITEIDEENPYFKIIGINSMLVGEIVNKVGRTTGWTAGTAQGTCIDTRVGTRSPIRWVLLCTTFAGYLSRGGDSGSPVFIRRGEDSDYVELIGINWGSAGDVGVFSSIDAVFDEVFPELSSGEERAAAVSYLCGRTREVLEEVVAIAGSANGCGEDLSLVTSLDLRDRAIGTLKFSEFSGLPNLERIDLSGNNLFSLPDEIFSGLPAGLEIYLHGNDASGESLTTAGVENLLEHLPHSAAFYLDGGDANLSGFGSSAYKFSEGDFMSIDINLGGGRPQNHGTIVAKISLQPVTAEPDDIPAGAFTFTFEGQRAAFSPPRASFAYLAPPLPEDLDAEGAETFIAGIEFVYEDTGMTAFTADTPTAAITIIDVRSINICDRTPQVRDAILASLGGGLPCEEILTERLAAIKVLNLSSTLLRTGDFDRLTGLQVLNLDNNRELPAGIFDNLTSLTELDLGRNELSELPAGIFDNLTSLKMLSLDGNRLSELPASIFDNLTSLTELNLERNELSELPEGIFDNLTSLKWLSLEGNRLREIPASIANLSSLDLP